MMSWLWLMAFLLSVTSVSAEILLPPGFSREVYVTGQGFESGSPGAARGIPATANFVFDETATLYLARFSTRFRQGEIDDLWPIYRVPPGGARMTPEAEGRYLYGPPLKNAQLGAVTAQGDLLVTTYDRERRMGALYRMREGRALLFAGGTPPPEAPPLFRNPEGVAVDHSGNIYVVDRDQGVVIKLDPGGTVLDPRYASVRRGRLLAFDGKGQLWIGGDGTAETPFQDGSGEIWKMGPEGLLTLVAEGPLVTGMGLSPAGVAFVTQRRTSKVLAITPGGQRIDFASTTQNSILRALAFAPVTPGTRRAGIAGDLFVAVSPQGSFRLSEVVRISGPFDEFIQRQSR